MTQYINVLVWKDISSQSLFFPDGALELISCAHINDGNYGLNMVGEIIPAGTATVPVTEPGTTSERQTIGVPAGNVYPDPTYFEGSDFKAVTRIKDVQSQRSYLVDTSDYNTKVAACNACCTPVECVAPVPALTEPPTLTTANVAWPSTGSVVGYEYVLTVDGVDPCVDPTAPGTFTEELSVEFTGLTNDTYYCVCVRSICGAGRYSAWGCIRFVTEE